MSDPVQFPRLPYFVTYYKDGVKHRIRRVPPPKLNDMLPQDIVKLNEAKNADWEAGTEAVVRNVNPHHPNIIQLEKKDGLTTFVPYFDLEMVEERAFREGKAPLDQPKNNRYLTWP